MAYPTIRLQRLRQHKQSRQLVKETDLSQASYILPVFIHEGLTEKQAVTAMPNIYQHSLDSLFFEAEYALSLGIDTLLLFGIPLHKDENGKGAYHEQGIIQQSIRQLKSRFPELFIIADCCLCEYSRHGHCGVMLNQQLDHQSTLESLAAIALSYAHAGVDMIAPSAMMDGMVTTIRQCLDQHHYTEVAIMSYAIKYASQLYGPFREVAGSHTFQGNRNHHQLNPSQKKEALREALLDEAEGADILMVKPASFYMDILATLAKQSLLPLASYHVSGEYAMIKVAAQHGLIDEEKTFVELYTGLVRSGASIIVSYYAKEMATIRKRGANVI